MFEGSRIITLYNGFLDFTKIDGREAGMVIVKQQIQLNPKLHEMTLNSKTSLQFHLKLLQVGKTSILYVIHFLDGDTKQVLGENYVKFVRMSRKTRRAIAFPEWFYEKYALYMNSSGHPALAKEILPEIPETAFKLVVVPNHSDTDRNNHVNQSSYIKFCMDVATHASLSGHYTHFTEDMCLYPSCQWVISYVGESNANDELHIYTWQQEGAIEHLYFSILLKGRTIFHASTIFEKDAKNIAIASRM
jgi:acyl-CoA thioesterase FadM